MQEKLIFGKVLYNFQMCVWKRMSIWKLIFMELVLYDYHFYNQHNKFDFF